MLPLPRALFRGRRSAQPMRATSGAPCYHPWDNNLPGARAESCSVRLSEVMGARTLPGPKPAKKRPTCSPPGAGRKGRGVSPPSTPFPPSTYTPHLTFHTTAVRPHLHLAWDVSPGWGEGLRCAAITEGALSGAAQRATNACYLGGSLLPSLGQQPPTIILSPHHPLTSHLSSSPLLFSIIH